MNPRSAALRLAEATPFYGILDAGYVPSELWESKLQALAIGGARIVQARAKQQTLPETESLLERALAAAAELPAAQRPLVVLNDHLDLCLRYPSVGLHIGQDDVSPREARDRLGPDRVLGLSTHSIPQAQAAIDLGPDILSYFAVGPVFPTQTKPDYIPVGLELVRWAAAQRQPVPFFCIGGINRQNVAQIAAAGAERVVTVSDVLLADDTAAAVQETIALLQLHPVNPNVP